MILYVRVNPNCFSPSLLLINIVLLLAAKWWSQAFFSPILSCIKTPKVFSFLLCPSLALSVATVLKWMMVLSQDRLPQKALSSRRVRVYSFRSLLFFYCYANWPWRLGLAWNMAGSCQSAATTDAEEMTQGEELAYCSHKVTCSPCLLESFIHRGCSWELLQSRPPGWQVLGQGLLGHY